MNKPHLAELERLRKRVGLLEGIIVEMAQGNVCPGHFFKESPACFGTVYCNEQRNCGNCWDATFAQTEGGEPDGE